MKQSDLTTIRKRLIALERDFSETFAAIEKVAERLKGLGAEITRGIEWPAKQ